MDQAICRGRCGEGDCDTRNGISFECDCGDNFIGLNCDIPVSPCFSIPCDNGGFCSEGGSLGFTCTCLRGYDGTLKTTFCARNQSPY